MRASFARPSALVLLLAAVLIPAGCTRRFYRKSADKQVEAVLTEKNVYPAWGIEQWHVYPDAAGPVCRP